MCLDGASGMSTIVPCVLCGNNGTGGSRLSSNETLTELWKWKRSSVKSLCHLLLINETQSKSVFDQGIFCFKCFLLISDLDFSLKQMSALERRIKDIRKTVINRIQSCYRAPNARQTRAQRGLSSMLFELAKFDESVPVTPMLCSVTKSECDTKRQRRSRHPHHRQHLNTKITHPDYNQPDEKETPRLEDVDVIEYKLDPDYILDKDSSNSEEEECFLDKGKDPRSSEDEQYLNKSRCKSSPNKKSSHKVKDRSLVAANYHCRVNNCQEFFNSAMNLKLHTRTIHDNDPEPYHCEFPHCFLKFDTYSGWVTHYDDHKDSQGRFSCTVQGCDKSFKKRGSLSNHLDTRHPPLIPRPSPVLVQPSVDRRRCDVCSLSFPLDKNQELEEHEKFHHTNVPFACVVSPCNVILTNMAELKLHVALTHEEIKIVCPCCPDKVFQTQIQLRFHLRRTCERRKKDSNVYQCTYPDCRRILISEKNLNEHLELHRVKRDYVCEQCGASYKQKKGLVRHNITSHLKETPYKCFYCDRAFPTITHLRQHEEIHSIGKNLLCSGCGKAFGNKANLRQHSTYYCSQRSNDKMHKGRKPNRKLVQDQNKVTEHSQLISLNNPKVV